METTALVMFTSTVKFVGDNIAIKPFCEFFGLDYRNQMDRIKRDRILSQLCGNFHTVAQDLKQREMFCLTKRGFLRWIDRISPQNVAENLRQPLIQFQILIDDYLNGSEAEHKLIAELLARKNQLRQDYSRIGLEIQNAERKLNEALNNRYQYQIQFTETKAIEN